MSTALCSIHENLFSLLLNILYIEFGITAPARNTLSVMMGPPLKSIYAQIAPGIEFDNLARAPQFSTQKFCTHFAISRSAGTFAVPKIPRNKGGFL